ncbi:unnamed protein product, partial [Rotaria sordida]
MTRLEIKNIIMIGATV